MAFEDRVAELGVLIARVQDAPADAHGLYRQVLRKINDLKAYGMPLPDDLARLEKRLELQLSYRADCAARKYG